jgi:hypothetical protein
MLKLHFLNVGHGDCCILEFPEKVAMVDINRNKNPDDQTMKELIRASNPDNARDIRGELEAGDIDKKTALEKANYTIPIQDPLKYLEKNSIKSISVSYPPIPTWIISMDWENWKKPWKYPISGP